MTVKHLGIAAAGTAVAAVAIGIGVGVALPDEGETPIAGDAYAKATKAALAFTGGGNVTQTHVGDEEGYYQVEVTMPDGTPTDVNLNQDFKITGNKIEPAGAVTSRTGPAPATEHPRKRPHLHLLGLLLPCRDQHAENGTLRVCQNRGSSHRWNVERLHGNLPPSGAALAAVASASSAAK